jgi:AcrR family transcriptional regulator
MNTTPSHPPRRRRAPADRPGEILAAAFAEFAERGFQATRMDDVARRAGCSKAAIYLYYADKTALFEAVVRRWLVSHLDGVRAVTTGHRGPILPLLAMIATRTVAVVSSTPIPDLIRLVIAESRAFPHLARIWHDEVIAQALPLVGSLISAGIARGEFRPVDPDFTARSLMAPLIFVTLWRSVFKPIGAPALDADAFIAHHVGLIAAGLRPQPDTASAADRRAADRRADGGPTDGGAPETAPPDADPPDAAPPAASLSP